MSPRRTKPTVAVAEHDAPTRRQLLAHLREDFTLLEADSYESVYRVLQEATPDVLLLDLELSAGGVREGLALLREIQKSELDTLVIVMSENDQRTTALRLMTAGAYDYFPKPVAPDVLRVITLRAAERVEIARENRVLREEFYRQQGFGDLIGASAPMQEVYEAIRKVAASDVVVIIRGESGTGKELVANEIHKGSRRAEHPFISINCAALPETLIEAELFGYEKGAFTGATATKEGRFELAHRGTLFLDEIGTLTPALQSKLLRVLEERAFVRLGGKKRVEVDVRLLTATNENLEEMVRQGRFRKDLYYRINVFPVQVPPLRERVEDIPLLVNYFLNVYCAANHVPLKRVDEAALRALERYAWPGNVRELQNVVQRMVLMTEGEVVGVRHLPPVVLSSPAAAPTDRRNPFLRPVDLDREVAEYEKQWLEAALGHAGGVKAEAARLLGLNKDRIKYLCRKHGITSEG